IGAGLPVAEHPPVGPELVELSVVALHNPAFRLVRVRPARPLVGELPQVVAQRGEHLAGHHRAVGGDPARTIGTMRTRTAAALAPRRVRNSRASRFRNSPMATLLGLIRSLPLR